MTSLSQSRALAGSRAFTRVRPRAATLISNGGKVFMRRNDSYMVEITVGEEEPEDIAIRRYMKAVMDSKVLEQLRARKTKETKIEAYKRRLRERHEMRKSGFEWPTYEEVEGVDLSPKAFDDFFSLDPDGDFGLPDMGSDAYLNGGFANDGLWGGYMDQQGAGDWQGGYMDQAASGYINMQQQGGYINAGPAAADVYANPQPYSTAPGGFGTYYPAPQGQGFQAQGPEQTGFYIQGQGQAGYYTQGQAGYDAQDPSLNSDPPQ